ELPGIAWRVLVKHAKEDDTTVPVSLPRGHQVRVLLATSDAPARPEVQDHHLSSEGPEVDGLAVQRSKRELGSSVTHELRRKQGRVASQPEGEDASEQGDDERPRNHADRATNS